MSYEQAVKIWAADFLNRRKALKYYAPHTWTPDDIYQVNFGGIASGYCDTCYDFRVGAGITINNSTEYGFDWEDLRVANLPELIDQIRKFDPELQGDQR